MTAKAQIFYRTHPGENRAPRPTWYSRELCLKSLLISFGILSQSCDVELTVLHDGYMQGDQAWSATLCRLAMPYGEIVEQPHAEDSAASIDSIRRGAALDRDTIVIYAEDDHFWLPEALTCLAHATANLPGDYYTPYDSPQRYDPMYDIGPHWHRDMYIMAGRHWRPHESTRMTFATKAQTLHDDAMYFELHRSYGMESSNASALFKRLQGLAPHEAQPPPRRRLLLGPMPSLGTYARSSQLAPCVAWASVARWVAAWPGA